MLNFVTSIACKVLNLRYVILQVLLGSIKVTAGLGEKFMIDVFTGLCKISGVRWRFSLVYWLKSINHKYTGRGPRCLHWDHQ